MATIPPYTPNVTGAPPTFNAAAASDEAATGTGRTLIVRNTDTVAHTVTVATPGSLPTGDDYPDKTYSLAANTGEVWIPLLGIYRDPSDGLAHISYDATTGVTRAVIRT